MYAKGIDKSGNGYTPCLVSSYANSQIFLSTKNFKTKNLFCFAPTMGQSGTPVHFAQKSFYGVLPNNFASLHAITYRLAVL